MHAGLWHTCTSTNSGLPAFRYVWDVYIDGTLIGRFKTIPLSGRGTFDAGPVVRSFLVPYFRGLAGSGLVAINTDDLFVDYQVKIGEEYYDAAGLPPGVVTVPDLTTVSARGWNCYPALFPDSGTDMDTTPGHLMSDRDQTQLTMPFAGTLLLPYFRTATGTPYSVGLRRLDLNGSPTGSYEFIAITGDTQMQVFKLTVEGINIAVGSTWLTAAHGGVQVNASLGFDVKVMFSCQPRFEYVALHFLNRHGGFETFFFELANRLQMEVERQTREARQYALQPAGLSAYTRPYNVLTQVYNRTEQPYAIRQNFKLKLVSDWITQGNKEWLMQLLASPEVYLQRGTWSYPVAVTDKQWRRSLRGADGHFNLELEVSINRAINSQFTP